MRSVHYNTIKIRSLSSQNIVRWCSAPSPCIETHRTIFFYTKVFSLRVKIPRLSFAKDYDEFALFHMVWFRKKYRSSLTLNYFLKKFKKLEHSFILGNVCLNEQLLTNDTANLWAHQKDLVGEYFQIYTEQGSSQVDCDSQWSKGFDKPIT
jgi:hypothetical protein